MSAVPDISAKCDRIHYLLVNYHLEKALQQIKSLLSGISDWEIVSEYENINTAYGYMLQYFGEGVPDEGRETLYRQLIKRTILLNDEICIQLMLPASQLLMFQKRRQRMNHTADYALWKKSLIRFHDLLSSQGTDKSDSQTDLILQDHETLLSNLFTEIWTSAIWDSVTYSEIKDIIQSDSIRTDDKCIIVSAVTMALFDRFDSRKLILLGETSSYKDADISCRALTGFVLAVSKYDETIPFFPEIDSLISLMSDSVDIQTGILSIQTALLMSRETDDVDREMREEILPSMLRNNPGLNAANDIMPDEINSAWENWMQDSDVQNNILKMSKMQEEGADIYLSTFSNLKSFPFFQEISNWFRPFSFDQPDVRSVFSGPGGRNSVIGRGILSSGLFCNSDKYSYCLTFNQIPEIQRNQMSEEILSQTEGTGVLDELDKSKPYEQYNLVARQYIQDLYRFFKLHPRHNEFWDPFITDTDIFGVPSLNPLTNFPQFSIATADLLLRKQHYQEAYALYMIMLVDNGPESTDWQIWQKTGYACQKFENYSEAIDAYIKADILEPDNLWIIRHIAYCYRMNGDLQKSLEYLRQAEKLAPEDMSLQLIIGETLVSDKQYNEALSHFFKVEYNNPDSIQSKRDIGWCSFLCGKYDQSIKYWTIVLNNTDNKATAQDFINAGHTELCAGNIQNAISHYSKAIDMCGMQQFVKTFNKERLLLHEKNVNPIDVSIMLDLLARRQVSPT